MPKARAICLEERCWSTRRRHSRSLGVKSSIFGSCTTSASRIARTIGTHTLARLLTLSRAPEVVLGGLNGSRRSGPSGSGGHGDRGPHPVAPHLSEDEPGRTGGEDRRL